MRAKRATLIYRAFLIRQKLVENAKIKNSSETF